MNKFISIIILLLISTVYFSQDKYCKLSKVKCTISKCQESDSISYEIFKNVLDCALHIDGADGDEALGVIRDYIIAHPKEKWKSFITDETRENIDWLCVFMEDVHDLDCALYFGKR